MSSNSVQTGLIVRRYTSEQTVIWNNFIERSANGTFLFLRDYMDYHSEMFEDFSYLIWKQHELLAVFVAGRNRNSKDYSTLVAHPGLTYGGLVHNFNIKYALLDDIYNAIFKFIQEQGFIKLIIKPVARVFCRKPNEASLFYLHQCGFVLKSRELNSVIDLTQPFCISKGRKDNVRKARNNGVIIKSTTNFREFWSILTANLWQMHNARPPHTQAEIELLQQKFPNNIKLYIAQLHDRTIGGVLLYLDELHGFVHTQYISANEQGKLVGAIDAIIIHLIDEVKEEFIRFSFGKSTVDGEINLGLLAQKEGFGTTVELMDIYEKQFI